MDHKVGWLKVTVVGAPRRNTMKEPSGKAVSDLSAKPCPPCRQPLPAKPPSFPFAKDFNDMGGLRGRTDDRRIKLIVHHCCYFSMMHFRRHQTEADKIIPGLEVHPDETHGFGYCRLSVHQINRSKTK